MNPLTSTALASIIVLTGTWAKGKEISIRLVVGGLFLAIGLSVMAEVNDKLARAFGLLIVVTALYVYGIDIVKKLGLT